MPEHTRTKQQVSRTKTCEKPGCSRLVKAHGLCSTHYNQTLPNRHAKILRPCDGCGAPVPKEARAQRYKLTFCSDLCRNWVQFGAWSTKLPADHISQCIGKTCSWNAPVRLRDVNCGWCGHMFPQTRSTSRFCSPRCLRKWKTAARRGRLAGAIGTYSWSEITRLWLKFDRCCAYCRRPLDLSMVQAEHVRPLSKHGANNLTNLLPSCRECNSDKRDLLLPDWAADRQRRGRSPVITTWTPTDPRYAHLVLDGQLETASA